MFYLADRIFLSEDVVNVPDGSFVEKRAYLLLLFSLKVFDFLYFINFLSELL